ncbi:preprotein translocase subunit YajC [Chloroflexota bacterium]
MTGWAPLIIFLVLISAMFYFLMFRPIRQREKKHDSMVEELQKGDLVITAGGIYGEVEIIDDDSVVLKVESGAMIRVTKGGVISRPEDRI